MMKMALHWVLHCHFKQVADPIIYISALLLLVEADYKVGSATQHTVHLEPANHPFLHSDAHISTNKAKWWDTWREEVGNENPNHPVTPNILSFVLKFSLKFWFQYFLGQPDASTRDETEQNRRSNKYETPNNVVWVLLYCTSTIPW
jgi:hypothetical protein